MTLTAQDIVAAARRADAAGLHGRKTVATVDGPMVAYDVERLFARGTYGNLYLARAGANDPVLLKIAREPRHNHLLEREAGVLADFGELPGIAAPFLPQIVESFDVDDAGGIRRRVMAQRYVEGLQRLPDALAARDLTWVFKQLLIALGFVHAAGYSHGDVSAEHILIRPEQRGLVLVGFTGATKEDRRKQDIAQAAATVVQHTLPLPKPFARFFAGCRPHLVPTDAFDLLAEFETL